MNDEVQTIMSDLISWATHNKYVIIKVNIDLHQDYMQATLYHYKTGEQRVLYYNGLDWEEDN